MNETAQPAGKLSVLLVDDHDLVRAGVRLMIEAVDGVGQVVETGSGEECVEIVKKQDPAIDIVFMDIKLPGGIDGVTAALRLLQFDFDVRIVMLTGIPDGPLPKTLLQAGVRGYMTKSSAASEVGDAIAAVSRGDIYISSEVARQMALTSVHGHENSVFDRLSERELQVVLLLMQGYRAKAAGDTLFLSEKTVSTYKRRAMEKVGADSAADLIRLAVEHGLLDST